MRFNFGANISERETQGLQGMTRRRRDSPERNGLMNKRRETVARFSQRASYSTADSAQQFSVETVPYNPFACSFFHLSLYTLPAVCRWPLHMRETRIYTIVQLLLESKFFQVSWTTGAPERNKLITVYRSQLY